MLADVSSSGACVVEKHSVLLLPGETRPEHPGSQVRHFNAAGSWCHWQGLVLAGQGQPGAGAGVTVG